MPGFSPQKAVCWTRWIKRLSVCSILEKNPWPALRRAIDPSLITPHNSAVGRRFGEFSLAEPIRPRSQLNRCFGFARRIEERQGTNGGGHLVPNRFHGHFHLQSGARHCVLRLQTGQRNQFFQQRRPRSRGRLPDLIAPLVDGYMYARSGSGRLWREPHPKSPRSSLLFFQKRLPADEILFLVVDEFAQANFGGSVFLRCDQRLFA